GWNRFHDSKREEFEVEPLVAETLGMRCLQITVKLNVIH
ncbi:hypothetical protein A2U01_0020628, partial [Trifolium medium]|nr:hypothetical protein [Trifolium medium]